MKIYLFHPPATDLKKEYPKTEKIIASAKNLADSSVRLMLISENMELWLWFWLSIEST